MFIATQFTIAVLWNQPRSLSANEWIKKKIYIPMFYLPIKENETGHVKRNKPD